MSLEVSPLLEWGASWVYENRNKAKIVLDDIDVEAELGNTPTLKSLKAVLLLANVVLL